jgi:hypothetical protein
MSPKMIEAAFEGAKQMYESGDVTRDDYLKMLKSIDAEKIPSTPENDTKKQELKSLIDSAISAVE